MQSNKTLHIVLDSYLNTFVNLLDEMNKEHKEKCQDVKNKILSIFPNLSITNNTSKLKEENNKLKEENKSLQTQLAKMPKIIKHEMTVHFKHRQDWSYGIRFNFITNKIDMKLNGEGKHSRGVIRGIFPRDKAKYIIGDAKIISQTNTLDGLNCGMARTLEIDAKTGIICTETPYNYKYGRNVTWESTITFVVTYLDL